MRSANQASAESEVLSVSTSTATALSSRGGAPKKRFALPFAKILIHQPWVQQLGGQATDVEIHARDLIATRRQLAGIYETTVGKPIDVILKDIERDYYMTAQEAKEYGIVDEVFTKENRTSTPNSPAAP